MVVGFGVLLGSRRGEEDDRWIEFWGGNGSLALIWHVECEPGIRFVREILAATESMDKRDSSQYRD